MFYKKRVHFNKIKNKKGSLELSITAIVIVVLAMTLLGLGLTFVKKIFWDITDISESAFGQIEERLQKDLINSDDKLIFSQSKVTIERGKETVLAWGLKNENPAPLKYWAQINPIRCPGVCPSVDTINKNWFTYKYANQADPAQQDTTLLYTLGAAEQHVKKLDLKVPKSAEPGLYLFEFSIYDFSLITEPDFGLYSSTEIFITVT